MLGFKQFRVKRGNFVLFLGVLLLAALTAIASPQEALTLKSSKKEAATVQPVVLAAEDEADSEKSSIPTDIVEPGKDFTQQRSVTETTTFSPVPIATKDKTGIPELSPPATTAANGEVWTLENSVKKAIQVSPVVLAADAEIEARKGALSQAGAWPNPSIGLSGSQKLGIEDRRGGTDLTQFSVSQPIPLGRLSRQSKQAKAEFEASKHERTYEQLTQENVAARNFHTLQLAEVKLKLANEKLKFAQHYQKNAGGKDPLVRYLAPLERKRLDIIRETADQEVATAEGEYSEALSNFQTFLRLPIDSSLQTTELNPIDLPASLERLIDVQGASHAAIAASKYEKEAADAAISVARGKRFEDPTITFFREKDSLDGRRQNYSGVMLNVTVPLWNFKNGEVAQAKAEAKKAEYKLETQKQVLQSKLKQTHLHLANLIKQANHYRTKILVPAKEMFDLTKKGFGAGEVNILSLIDASDTYFDARKRYLELLYESYVEAAELRLAAGISILNHNELSPGKTGEKL